jgi:hypothetical protein
MDSLERKSSRPILEISTPSIKMVPEEGSISRKSTVVRVLLPAPVRPTIPALVREGDGGGND